MDIRDVRAKNLKQLAAEHGGATALARKLDCTPAFMSRRIGKNATAKLGHNFCRKTETTLGLIPFWMDTVHAMPSSEGHQANAGAAVPLLASVDLLDYLADPAEFDHSKALETVASPSIQSNDGFAILTDNAYMDSDSGLSIPKGAQLFCEPNMRWGSGTIVLVQSDHYVDVREITNNLGTLVARPLNRQLPAVELSKEVRVIAVVVAVCLLLPLNS